MTLNQRITKDLNELYNGGNTPGVIQDALQLNGLIPAKAGQTSFATMALNGYYSGDLEAKTVMVMFNPGCDVSVANSNLPNELQKRNMKNAVDFANFHDYSKNYGHYDRLRQDAFDLKQAFFLKSWQNSGIAIPKSLCANSGKQAKLDSKEIVLTQKLQLDLIPYASSKFEEFTGNISLVFPFLETLFDAIFSFPRKYVIFCSGKFETIFKEYEKANPGTISCIRKAKKKIPGRENAVSCSVITVKYQSKEIRAIIANTFHDRSLPNAYNQMEAYGEFCYQEFIKP